MNWIELTGAHDPTPIILRIDTITAIYRESPEHELMSALSLEPVRKSKPVHTRVDAAGSSWQVAESIGEVWDKIEEAGAG